MKVHSISFCLAIAILGTSIAANANDMQYMADNGLAISPVDKGIKANRDDAVNKPNLSDSDDNNEDDQISDEGENPRSGSQ